jgi:serine/threonine-protein kinase
MALTAGTQLAEYEIVALIGAGGMGEVYRARDTKLGREVAIKILPEAFSQDKERLARFEREARLLASLNHPNIATIHGLEESGGVRFLVMELVEGETLAELIARGPVPVDEALPLFQQIAEGLEAAHEKGVIHRDLKPANVKITPEGKVKVLDFGLAKAFSDEAPAVDLSQSPTLTTEGTRAGVIMGTAAYMSPEQARGRTVDKRTDIWTFGQVLYETLTGEKAFEGETVTDILASVIKSEPAWKSLPADTPWVVQRLLRRCLEKEPRRRLQDIGDARIEIEEAFSEPAGGLPSVVQAVAEPRLWRRAIPWSAAALLAVALAVAFWAPWRVRVPQDRPLMRFTVDLGSNDSIGSTIAISPDGTRVVYRAANAASVPGLATRLLSETTETFLAGTEGAYNPFFSPDGQWIAFFSFASSQLLKMPVQGGVPITLCDAPLGRGGSWGEDGTIVAELDPFSGIWRVSDQGGPPVRLTRPSRDRHAWPQFLPGSRAILYSAGPHGLMERGHIKALPLDGGESMTLLQGGYQARYLPTGETTGHLVYIRLGVLYAVPFDPVRLEVLGEPVQMLDDVASTASQFGAAWAFSVSGTFVYASGEKAQSWPLAWYDSSGTLEPLAIAPGAYYTPRVSPDGGRVVLSIDSDRGQDVFVYDIGRDTLTRLTSSGEANLWPVWAPDGEHVLFTSITAEGGALWWTRADGTSQPQQLLASRNLIRQIAISPDGRHVGYTEQDPETASDLWILPLDVSNPDGPRPEEPRAILKTNVNEGAPAFSPDGRWIAYITDELGPFHTWVQDFPELRGRWQVSSRGGGYPFWSHAAQEFFYSGGRGTIRVEYATEGDRFVLSRPDQWELPERSPAPVGFETLDLAPDGKRFLIFPDVERKTPTGPGQVTFLLNFFEELRRRGWGKKYAPT